MHEDSKRQQPPPVEPATIYTPEIRRAAQAVLRHSAGRDAGKQKRRALMRHVAAAGFQTRAGATEAARLIAANRPLPANVIVNYICDLCGSAFSTYADCPDAETHVCDECEAALPLD